MHVNANTLLCAACVTGVVAVRDRDVFAASVIVIFERLGQKVL